MLQVRLTGAVALAVIMALAFAAASANASELPEFGAEASWTATSGTTKLFTSEQEITCKSSTSVGTAKSKKSGSYTADLKECKTLGFACNSLGDTKETILLSGEWSLVPLKTEDFGVLVTLKEAHIECSVLGLLILIKGGVLGLITPVHTITTKYELKLASSEKKQEITEYENDEGKGTKAGLEASINGGAFKGATEESVEDKVTTGIETVINKGESTLFKISVDKTPLAKTEKATFTIKNISGKAAAVKEIQAAEKPNGEFTWKPADAAACLKAYAINEACSWKVEYSGANLSLLVFLVVDEKKDIADKTVIGK